jgi:hypothetical protein
VRVPAIDAAEARHFWLATTKTWRPKQLKSRARVIRLRQKHQLACLRCVHPASMRAGQPRRGGDGNRGDARIRRVRACPSARTRVSGRATGCADANDDATNQLGTRSISAGGRSGRSIQNGLVAGAVTRSRNKRNLLLHVRPPPPGLHSIKSCRTIDRCLCGTDHCCAPTMSANVFSRPIALIRHRVLAVVAYQIRLIGLQFPHCVPRGRRTVPRRDVKQPIFCSNTFRPARLFEID